MMHDPVLLEEVVRELDPKPDQNFIDATIGEGGHAKAILEKTSPQGKILGIDWDFQQIERTKQELLKLSNRLILVHDSFTNLEAIVAHNPQCQGLSWQGIIFDLGWSQAHIEDANRGFSFLRDETLDMRYDITKSTRNAKEIINTWDEKQIAGILRDYGNERFANRIAALVVKERNDHPIQTTFQLVDVITRATPGWYHHQRIHPATRTFQALRIAVNDEYGNIDKGVRAAFKILKKGNTILTITFHSGEDRIIKQLFQAFSYQGGGYVRTPKPIRASLDEKTRNPRSRSAKLRIFERA